MSTDLPDWPREFFQKNGGRPFLFFVVYGEFAKLPSLSASRYRSSGIPAGFELSRYDLENHAEILRQFQDGYLWEEFCGRNPELAARVHQSKECIILRGEIEDCATLNYLRDAVGLTTFLLDHGAIAVYDPFMFQWWEPEVWMSRIFEPAGAVPRHHVVILTSEESDPALTWFHTRGTRKFGRPDLSIHNVSPSLKEPIIELCERFIEFQAFGGIIKEGMEVKMKSLPKGMTCHHHGHLDDPEFNNVHVAIQFGK